MSARAVSAVRGFVFGFWVMVVFATIINEAHAQAECPAGEVKVYRYFNEQPRDGRTATGAPNCTAGSIERSSVTAVASACAEVGADPWQDFGVITWAGLGSPVWNGSQWTVVQNTDGGYYYKEMRITEHCAPAPVQQCTVHPSGTVKNLSGDGAFPPESACDSNCLMALDDGGISVGVGSVWGGRFKSTGQPCSGQAISSAASSPSEQCQHASTGVTVCTGGNVPRNCVSINGTLSCYSSAGDFCTTAACTQAAAAAKLPDQSVVAKPDQTTAPVPYGPTGPRAPTATYSATRPASTPGSGTGGAGSGPVNYYSPNTVANSCSGPCSPGESPPIEVPPDPQEEEGSGSFSAPDVQYDFGDESQSIADAKSRMGTEFANIRSEAEALFGGVQGGTGGLPVFTIETRWGVKTVDLSRWESKVAPIGALLIFISMVSAAFIIFGGRD